MAIPAVRRRKRQLAAEVCSGMCQQAVYVLIPPGYELIRQHFGLTPAFCRQSAVFFVRTAVFGLLRL